jgi:hypothetical protein
VGLRDGLPSFFCPVCRYLLWHPPDLPTKPQRHNHPERYDVFLFSKPNTLLAWFSLPVIKLMQLRYVNDSVAAVAGKVA